MDCAVLFAYYSRRARVEEGRLLVLFIARYLCRRKGKAPAGCPRTFSLLPSELIPYHCDHVNLTGLLLHLWIAVGLSVDEVSNTASRLCHAFQEWLIEPSYLYRLKALFMESVFKVNHSSGYLSSSLEEGVMNLPAFLGMGKEYQSVLMESGPTGFSGLALDYYFHQSGWEGDAHFLFGTASQFRSSS